MKKAANVLETRKEKILEAWLEKVKEEMKGAQQNADLVLTDHLPHLLQDMAAILRRFENYDVIGEEKLYEEIFESSIEHGRHRATTKGYTLDQILREYITFHRVLTQELMLQDAYSSDVGVVVKYSIENAMLYSGGAFHSSMQEMRQKMVGFLAHDMRNPISAAFMALGFMKYDDGPERFEKMRRMARSSLKRSLAMIEDLLDSISVEAGEGITIEFAEGNLMKAISSVHAEAAEIYNNKILLQAKEQEITGVFDLTMIRRVLENFLSNAIKYGSRETPVTIIVEDNQEDVVLRVRNHGNPIPEERKDAIFEFLNTTGSYRSCGGVKSWGMGLSLIKAVAEAHDGQVQVESSEEEGTIFSIFLSKYRNQPGKTKAEINYFFRRKG